MVEGDKKKRKKLLREREKEIGTERSCRKRRRERKRKSADVAVLTPSCWAVYTWLLEKRPRRRTQGDKPQESEVPLFS